MTIPPKKSPCFIQGNSTCISQNQGDFNNFYTIFKINRNSALLSLTDATAAVKPGKKSCIVISHFNGQACPAQIFSV